MRQPSDAFVGVVFGSIIVLLAPSNYMNSEVDLIRWIVVFLGLGAIIGTVIGKLRQARP